MIRKILTLVLNRKDPVHASPCFPASYPPPGPPAFPCPCTRKGRPPKSISRNGHISSPSDISLCNTFTFLSKIVVFLIHLGRHGPALIYIYMYIYVYVYICMCIHIYVYIYITCIYLCVKSSVESKLRQRMCVGHTFGSFSRPL